MVWPDPIESYFITGNFDITQKVKNIQRIEYLTELASIYPMFRERTVIVLDLRDPKFNIKYPNSDRLYTLDYLIRNAVRHILLQYGIPSSSGPPG